MRLSLKPLLVKFLSNSWCAVYRRSVRVWPNRRRPRAGDVWAMNADPDAPATVVVPFGIESEVEETLFQLMSGARRVARRRVCPWRRPFWRRAELPCLAHREVEKDLILRKTSVESGQVLVLPNQSVPALLPTTCSPEQLGRQKAFESMRQPSKRPGGNPLPRHHRVRTSLALVF